MKTISTIIFFILAVFISGTNLFAASEGNSNTFYGTNAGANTAGDDDEATFVGFDAGASNTSGRANSFIGYRAGRNNTEGSGNTFLGSNAGVSNTTGGNNIFFGIAAGSSNLTGSDNNFIGALAAQLNTTGSNNNFLGYQAGFNNTEGSSNSFIGSYAGYNNTTGDNNWSGGGSSDKEKIEVRELKKGTNTYEFDYFITAKRGGFEGHEPIQPNTHFTADMKTAADFEKAYEKTDDLTVNVMRNLLISNGILTKEGKLNKETAARLGWMLKNVEVAVQIQ